MRRSLIVLALTFSAVATLPAQRFAESRAAFRVASASSDSVRSPSYGERFTVRMVTGTMGMGAAVLTLYALTGPYSACDGDVCSPNASYIGLAAIGMIGTAVGASLPNYESKCSRGERFFRGIGGSVAGLAFGGLVAGALAGANDFERAIPIVLGPPYYAALAQGSC